VKRLYQLALFAIFFGITCHFSDTMAQNATVRGFLYEKESGEPVIFSNVYLKGTSYGSATDVNGYFTITQIPPGKYRLMVTYLGYDSLTEDLTLKPGEIVNKKYFLNKSSVMLETVNVSAERQASRTETRTSVVKITPKQISQLPSIGGQPDLAQYLQVLPGVIFTGDQGGQLYIRGGSPIQNKVLLDGMIIYNPFHSIGLFSVFETDMLRNADIYTGGFNAEYGGRISAVMNITTRDGNKKRYSGKIQGTTFGANAMLEGPIKKAKADNDNSSSFILSFKNSYLEQSSKLFYNYVDTNGLPFNYTDFYGKVSLNAGNGSKINFFGFNFDDQVNYRSLTNYHWKSSGAGTNFVVIPGRSPVLMEGYFSYSRYNIDFQEDTLPVRTSAISGFNSGLNFTYFLGKSDIKYGLEMLGFKTDFDFYNAVGRKISQTENTTELVAFVRYKGTFGKLLVEPGLRLHYYASLSEMSPEPRLALKYNLTNDVRLKFAGGYYSQNFISASSDRDVVNLFYGFLSGPDNLPESFDGEDITSKLQKAQHAIAGIEFDLFSNVLVNLEAYYKNFSQLTNLNRNKIYEDTGEYADKPDDLKKDFIVENGYARGIDISVKYDYNHIYLWGVYSYTQMDRYDGKIHYYPHFDRRHNVNLMGSYTFGENQQWEVSMRWNFGSGFPFTLSQGYYEKLFFENGVNSNLINQNGQIGTQYGPLNAGRLPTYHRLDFSALRRFVLSETSTMEANFSMTNLYDRDNIFYVNRMTNDKIYQLPIMPSLGLKWSF